MTDLSWSILLWPCYGRHLSSAPLIDPSESWKRREAVIRHCVSTIDDRLDYKAQALQDTPDGSSSSLPPISRTSQNDDFRRLDADRVPEPTGSPSRTEIREGMWAEEVKVRERTLVAVARRSRRLMLK